MFVIFFIYSIVKKIIIIPLLWQKMLLLLLLMILSTSPWGLSELWGGGVPTLEIHHSGPRIRCLLLRTLINPPRPPLFFSYVPSPPSSSTVLLCMWSSVHPGVTRPRPRIPIKLRPLPPLIQHHRSLTLPPLHRPHHACQISVAAAPMLLPKYILAWPSAAVPRLSGATTAHAPSPRPRTPSISVTTNILEYLQLYSLPYLGWLNAYFIFES